jgi:hypothetical protein
MRRADLSLLLVVNDDPAHWLWLIPSNPTPTEGRAYCSPRHDCNCLSLFGSAVRSCAGDRHWQRRSDCTVWLCVRRAGCNLAPCLYVLRKPGPECAACGFIYNAVEVKQTRLYWILGMRRGKRVGAEDWRRGLQHSNICSCRLQQRRS